MNSPRRQFETSTASNKDAPNAMLRRPRNDPPLPLRGVGRKPPLGWLHLLCLKHRCDWLVSENGIHCGRGGNRGAKGQRLPGRDSQIAYDVRSTPFHGSARTTAKFSTNANVAQLVAYI